MTDLTRYPIGNDSAGRITLWCSDCPTPTPRIKLLPIWNEDDAAEQVTELCLANLVAIVEEHERKYHGDAPEPLRLRFDFTQFLKPERPAPAPHRVKVRTVRVLGPNREDDWDDETTYDIEHTPQCDALPYMQECWLDQQQTDAGTSDWPTEPGEYTATGEAVKSFNGEYTEYDFYMHFEPAPPAEETPR